MTNRLGSEKAGKTRQRMKKIAAGAGASPGCANAVSVHAEAPTLDLAAAQLISGATCAATGEVAISTWGDLVARGIAPEPVFRAPRFTRWRASEVARFWLTFRPEDAAGAACVAQAVKASAKAAERRRAATGATEGR